MERHMWQGCEAGQGEWVGQGKNTPGDAQREEGQILRVVWGDREQMSWAGADGGLQGYGQLIEQKILK